MIYPENTANSKLITNWITQAQQRANAQLQDFYIIANEIRTPFYLQHFGFTEDTVVLEFPDGYIAPVFPAKTGEYQTNVERLPMAKEAAENFITNLTGVAFNKLQEDTLFQTFVLRFFQRLYTWNTSLVWIDKVHPEEVIGNILFQAPVTTYAKRVPLVNVCSPDIFLRNWSIYDLSNWSDKLTEYSSLDERVFLINGEETTVFTPSNTYSWLETSYDVKREQLTATLTANFVSLLVNGSGVSAETITQQRWVSRIRTLSYAAVYGNVFFSYLINFYNSSKS